MLKLTRNHASKMQQFINGKLIAPGVDRFEEVSLKIQELTRQIEQLETQAVVLNQQTQRETLEQFNAVKSSVKRVGKLYGRLLGVALGTTLGLTGLWFWLDSNPNSCSQFSRGDLGETASILKL